MDVVYDMNTYFTPAKSRSNICEVLTTINLQKYLQPLLKRGVDFHTFCNLTREDMRLVGITNHADQTLILETTSPLSAMYKDLNNRPPNWKKIVANVRESTQLLGGILISLLQYTRTMPLQHSLVDPQTSTSQAICEVLEILDKEIDILTDDLNKLTDKFGIKEKKNTQRRKSIIIGSLVGSTVILGLGILLIKYKVFSYN